MRVLILFFSISLFLFSIPAISQQPKLVLPIGHTQPITDLGYSGDYKLVFTSSQDNSVKIWSVANGKQLNSWNEFKATPNAVFSPDGPSILMFVPGEDSAVYRNAITGNEIFHFLHKGIFSASFNSDGKKMVTASKDGLVKIWDMRTGKLTIEKNTATALKEWPVRFSRDGKKILLVGSDGIVSAINAATGNSLYSFNVNPPRARFEIGVDEDGKKLAVFSNELTRIYNLENGSLLKTLDSSEAFEKGKFSLDGNLLLATKNVEHTVWDLNTGKKIFERRYGYRPSSLSPDGKKIVFGHLYKSKLLVFELATGKELRDTANQILVRLPDEYWGINVQKYSRDGKTILGATSNGITRVWTADGNKILSTFSGNTQIITSSAISPDGNKVATISAQICKIWDVATGRLLSVLEGGRFMPNCELHFNATGDRIYTYLYEERDNDDLRQSIYENRLWDTKTGKLIIDIEEDDDGPFEFFQFSHDGNHLITYDDWTDGLYVWDTQNGNRRILDSGLIESVVITGDDKLILAGSGQAAKVWDLETGKLKMSFNGHTNRVMGVAIHPDRTKILTASWDSTVKTWDLATGKLLHSMDLQLGYLKGACYDAAGKRVLAYGARGFIIWDALNGNVIARPAPVWAVTRAAFYKSGIVLSTNNSTNPDFFDEKGNLIFKITRPNYEFNSDESKVAAFSLGHQAIQIFDSKTGSLLESMPVGLNNMATAFTWKGNKAISIHQSEISLFDIAAKKKLYSIIGVDSTDWLAYRSNGNYDGSDKARKLLYFTCGMEIVELEQIKDQLWIPNLAERIMRGDTINAKTLADLKICGLTPEINQKQSSIGAYQFNIKPGSGGLGETVVLVNGIEARRYKSSELKKNVTGYDLTINPTELNKFFVSGAENFVSVKTYTSDNSISSRGLIVKGDKQSEKASSAPNLYAVMVGISDYKGDELDLKYAAKDATDISKAVSAAAKKLLNTDGKEHVFMYDLTTYPKRYQLPEKAAIKKILEEIGTKATPNDILLIFFAGHGVMESTKKQFYFLTADASRATAGTSVSTVGISTAELTEWMKPQNIKAQKRILIFDACNSGQAIKDFVKMGNADQNYIAARNDEKAQQVKAIDKLNEQSGLFILSASASDQNAYEMGRYSQGLLTYSLLKAIKQQPDILQDGKYLDVSRWFNAAEKTVSELTKENGARQQPQIVSNTNFNIGIVDEDVLASITLPQEKPLFTNSNLQNSDENIAMDDLELNKMLDAQLNSISSRGTSGPIVYSPNIKSADAWALGGRYEVKGNTVIAKVNIRRGKEIKHRFEIAGTTDKLSELVIQIAEKASSLVK